MRSLRSMFAAVGVLVVLAGCVTPPARQLQSPTLVDHELFRLEMEYLDRTLLAARYGGTDNPFIAAPMFITPVEFLVFDLAVTEIAAGHELEVERIEFDFGGQSHSPTTPARMRTYWASTDVSARMNAIDEQRFYSLLNNEMINRSPGAITGSGEGLLVFRARSFPEYGEGTLTIPIYSPSEGRVERITIPVRFTEDRSTER